MEEKKQKTNHSSALLRTLYKGDVITKEQYDHTQKAWESTKAQLNAAKKQLTVSSALIQNSVNS